MHILRETKTKKEIKVDQSVIEWLELGDVRTDGQGVTYYSSHNTEYEYVKKEGTKYKQKPSSWRKKTPIDMANRVVACDIIKSIGSEKIQKIPDNKLREVFLLPVVDENGGEGFEIDWEFIIFEATEYQIGKLLDWFIPVKKKKEPKILGKDGKSLQQN